MKFLDYTICLVTGEIVYSVAFRDLLYKDGNSIAVSLSCITLAVAGSIMWKTSSLAKSFIIGVGFFILSYYVYGW